MESTYQPKIGDVWRKDGPVSWARVEMRMWPGMPEYDGKLMGASVRLTNMKGKWENLYCFCPASTPDDFADTMESAGRYLEINHPGQ